jgi:hypothetical protein
MDKTSASIWKRQFLPQVSIIRFIRWAFSWRIIRRFLFGLACLATLIALFYAEENWRGKHAWEKYKGEQEAKGDHFDLSAFIPLLVPDDQNFAVTPLLVPLFKYDPTRSPSWLDTNGIRQVDEISLYVRGGTNQPPTAVWNNGEPVDLEAWQNYFRGTEKRSLAASDPNQPRPEGPATGVTNFWPITSKPQEPAKDVLLALSKFDTQLEELRLASARPHSRFPIHYDEVEGAFLAHLAAVKRISGILTLRAIAELKIGRNQPALDDMKLAFSFAEAVKPDATLISQLVRLVIIQESLQPVWEGLAAHRWSEKEVEEIENDLGRLDLLSEYDRAVRIELAFLNEWIEGSRRRFEGYQSMTQFGGIWHDTKLACLLYSDLPHGWFYRNELFASRFFHDKVFPLIDAPAQLAYPDLERASFAAFDALPLKANNFALKGIGVAMVPGKFSRAQTDINLARVACALERYWRANGHYPGELNVLVPAFIQKVPHDIINGQPLKYRRTEDGQYLLYSIGWNEKDDGGVYPTYKKRAEGQYRRQISDEHEEGDWVWRFPSR